MASPLPPEYWHTTYFADTPLGHLRLRVGLDDWPTQVILQREQVASWAILTAWNPAGQIKAPDENHRRNLALATKLATFPNYPARGVGDMGSHFEESFFVVGISRENAVAVAREFGQNAILFGERGTAPELIDCRPDPSPA